MSDIFINLMTGNGSFLNFFRQTTFLRSRIVNTGSSYKD